MKAKSNIMGDLVYRDDIKSVKQLLSIDDIQSGILFSILYANKKIIHKEKVVVIR